MIIDEELIAQNGITIPLIASLIEKHEQTHERYRLLRDYYMGNHKILERRRTSSGSANNKVVVNHAKYIVDTSNSYLLGNPVTYEASEGYDIEPIKDCYLSQDISSIDFEIGKDVSIFGHGYELVYMRDKEPRSIRLKPWNAFVCYSDDCCAVPLFGVYYYKSRDIFGNISGLVCNVYTDEYEYTYQSKSDSWNALELTYEGRHYFKDVQLIEYTANEAKQGDFEQLIPLIDVYNILMSDRVNDKEQFVDAFLFLTGLNIDSEQAKKLRAEKVLMGYEGASAQYLSKNLNEADTKVLRDDLKEDIHRMANVPDLTDNAFSGNLSGVAIKYKLMGFEQQVLGRERYLTKGLKKRFELYNNILQIKAQMQLVPVHRVDVIFIRNLPANDLETSQMINYLSGMVTQETLLGQLGFVGDAKEEAKLARKEAEEKAAAAVKAMREPSPEYNDNEE